MVKRCSYGTCNSDDRYPERLEGGVTFIPFPKPIRNRERCLRWIKLCGRPHSQLNIDKIKKHTYVCTKHFANGKPPTDENPDPLPAKPFPSANIPRKAPKRQHNGKILESVSVEGNSQETAAGETVIKAEQSPIHEAQVPDNRDEQRSSPSSSEEHRLTSSVTALAVVESPLKPEILTAVEIPVPLAKNMSSHKDVVTKIPCEPAKKSELSHPFLLKPRACPDCATSRMFDALHSYLLRKAHSSLAAESLSPTELPEPACAQHRSPGDDSDSASLSCEHDHSGNIAELFEKYKNALNVIDLLNITLEREQKRSNELALEVSHLSSVIKFMLGQGSSSSNSASGDAASTGTSHAHETDVSKSSISDEPEDIKPNIDDTVLKLH